MTPELREKLDHLPTEPGVYLMRDRSGEVIYVGKAINLIARVRRYFNRSGDERAFVALLDDVLGDLEVVVVRTEKEALLLENELIKKYQPRFNVVLRDDKSFICLRLDERGPWPRLEIVRAAQLQRRSPKAGLSGPDGARYFGPYSSASSIRETLRLINRHFRLRTCSDRQLEQCQKRGRPCLQYQIGRCPAPCIGKIGAEEYAANVRDVVLFLKGEEAAVAERIRDRMAQAAERLHFELAARLRDQLAAVQKSLERQRMISPDPIDRDVLGVYREADRLMIYLLYVRAGRLSGGRPFFFAGQEFPTEELIASFVDLYYGQEALIPDEVLLPVELEDADATEAWLTEQRGRRVRLATPRRGAKAELVELAKANAETSFHDHRRSKEETASMLARLQGTLGLTKLPRRIECYDISLFQGASAVGSKVSFLDGEPDSSQYRRFRIKSVQGTDDFAMLYEVLSRRVKQGELPDLFVIDGGKGQLGSAAAALKDNGVRADIVSLAKSRVLDEHRIKSRSRQRTGGNELGADVVSDSKEAADAATSRGSPREIDRSPERVFVLGRKDPVVLRQDSPENFLLTRLRDEAHRFAITYHRLLRGRRSLAGVLETIPGVAAGRRKALLKHFGSVTRLRAATIEELSEVEGIGPALAAQIHAALRPAPAEPAPEPAPGAPLSSGKAG